MKALNEYKTLPSVREKLAFDPSGRPGATDVRADQARLEGKRAALHSQYRAQLGMRVRGTDVGFEPGCPSEYRYRTASEYVSARQNERKRRYFAGLECAAYAERDKREGSPRELLGLSITPEYGQWIDTKGNVWRDALELRDVRKIGPDP